MPPPARSCGATIRSRTYFYARNPCCDLVNRGVAVWKGKVYVASVDGRLHALDAATGKKIWEADTIVDHKLPYSSTGAPQIAGNVVVIGNSGADMGHGAVRGYVSAYDLETGAFKWRFFTVPPAGRDSRTRIPNWRRPTRPGIRTASREFNGGGTAWDGFAYDPELNLVYFGTANAAPYDLRQLGPANGSTRCTPHRSWRCMPTPGAWPGTTRPRRATAGTTTAVQKLVLADLQGRRRAACRSSCRPTRTASSTCSTARPASCSRPRTSPT